MEIKFELHCTGADVAIGRGWKFRRGLLPEVTALLMRCINGRWKGKPVWEVYAWALDREAGFQADYTGMRWTNQQRKWFERHMKKLTEGNV